MNAPLIAAAEAALAALRDFHRAVVGACPGPEHCPTASAIANLEAELAKVRRVHIGTVRFGPDGEVMDPRDVANAILRAK